MRFPVKTLELSILDTSPAMHLHEFRFNVHDDDIGTICWSSKFLGIITRYVEKYSVTYVDRNGCFSVPSANTITDFVANARGLNVIFAVLRQKTPTDFVVEFELSDTRELGVASSELLYFRDASPWCNIIQGVVHYNTDPRLKIKSPFETISQTDFKYHEEELNGLIFISSKYSLYGCMEMVFEYYDKTPVQVSDIVLHAKFMQRLGEPPFTGIIDRSIAQQYIDSATPKFGFADWQSPFIMKTGKCPIDMKLVKVNADVDDAIDAFI